MCLKRKGASLKNEVRRFLDAAWPLDPLEKAAVRRWRVAGRTTLGVLLAFSALQYYFFDVYLTILAMPRVTWLAALP